MILIIILVVLILILKNLRKPAYIRKVEKKQARAEAFDTLDRLVTKGLNKLKEKTK
jgi:hypothetical protein